MKPRFPLQFRRKPAGHPGAGVAWVRGRYRGAERPALACVFWPFSRPISRPLMKPRSTSRCHKHQGKNGGEWRFFEGQKRHFSVAWAKAPKHKPLAYPLLCQPTILASEGDKNGGRHFRARSLSTRLRGRVFNSSVHFLRLVFPFLAAAADPPCLPPAFRFPLSAVHRNAPHRSHVPSDPLNSSLRSTSSWPPRRRRRRNRALPFAFTLRSGLAINRLRSFLVGQAFQPDIPDVRLESLTASQIDRDCYHHQG